jgi:hypothetical protein
MVHTARLRAGERGSMEPTATVLDLNQLRRSCSSCALHELCLPAGIGIDDMNRLDATVKDKRTLDRGAVLYREGDTFDALYVVRSGSLKTFVQNEAGDMQILAFHLPARSSASMRWRPTSMSARPKRWNAPASANCHMPSCNRSPARSPRCIAS